MKVNQRRAGAMLSYVSLAIHSLISFFYVPILLGFLSTPEYGVYELIGSLVSYLSIMDLGLSTTLSRFYVEAKAKGDKTSVENLLATAAVIYGVITIAAVALGIVCDMALPNAFGSSFASSELELAHQMMQLVILNCVVVLPGNWFLALINANERFVFARVLSLVKYILQFVAVICILNVIPSAFSVLLVQVILNAASIVMCGYYTFKRLHISCKFHSFDWGLIGRLFSFSFFILLNMVFDQVFWKTGQIVLGIVNGASAVAVYGIVCTIAKAYMQVSTGVTSVFLPKLTALSTKTSDMKEINDLFNRIGHIQAILVWGVCGVFISVGQDFIMLWAGADFSEAYLGTVLIMIGLSVSLIQNLGISILQAKNKMGFRAIVYTALAVLDLLISIPASYYFGVTGCAAVAALLLLLGTGPIINYYYHRVIKLDIPAFFKEIVPVLVPVLVSSVGTIVLLGLFPQLSTVHRFILGIAIYGIFYCVMLCASFFSAYERELFHGIASRMAKR